jgi:hypothetical protein
LIALRKNRFTSFLICFKMEIDVTKENTLSSGGGNEGRLGCTLGSLVDADIAEG